MTDLTNYAKALIEISIKEDNLDEILTDFEIFMKLIYDNPCYIKDLSYQGHSKIQYLDKLEGFTKTFISFLKLVTQDSQIRYIKRIYNSFREFSNIYEKELYFKVFSKRKLTKDEVKFLTNYLSNGFHNQKIILKLKVDTNILGGIKILFKGQSLDLTLTSQLKSLFESI